MEAVRAPEEEGDPPDEEWDAFEQRWSVRGAAFLTIGGVPQAATVDENDDVQLYALEGSPRPRRGGDCGRHDRALRAQQR